MKVNTILFRFLIVCITSTFLFLQSCSKAPITSLNCSALIDVTGSNVNTHSLEHLTIDGLKEVLEISDKGTEHNVIYRQTIIADAFLNRHYEFRLNPAPSFITGNQYDYQDKVNAFLKGIDSVITLAKNDRSGRGTSSVYLPIARELRRLSRVNSDKKILLVFSDLIENTDFLTFLGTDSEKTLSKLKNKPEKIEEILHKELPLPDDLQGIIVYIIHDVDIDTEPFFKPLSRLYQKMLEKRGAIVNIQANL